MDKEIVVCLGSSTIAAKGTYNWIRELEQQPQNKNFTFINLGVGGDLSYNALSRLPKVLASKPDKVFMLIGGNDILATVFPNVKRFFTKWKQLPNDPSPLWFGQNVEKIIKELKKKTMAEVFLISLPQVGEDPTSANPTQTKLNRLYEEYNNVLKNIAQKEKINYIPLYEELHKQILAFPGKAFTRFSFLSFYRDYVFREFLLKKSFDQIAKLNGWKFHIDGVHLNTNGGKILVELVQKALNK
jgi:lysophospholipase L1-like esterase